MLYMCPPEHYRIVEEINPWMDVKNTVVREDIFSEWLDIYNSVRLYEDIKIIPAAEKLPDMCFVANAGVFYRDSFIVSNFRYQIRKSESYFISKYFSENNIQIVALPMDVSFEGSGDLIRGDEKHFFLGHGPRTSYGIIPYLSIIIDESIIPLHLINPYFYHLDMCLLPIPQRQLLIYYPEAFDEKSIHDIQQFGYKTIELSSDNAKKFACNSFIMDNNAIIPLENNYLEEILLKEKISVKKVNISEFAKSGGGIKCLILERIRRGEK